MVRQKALNFAGITAGLGALVVLLIGFALALQIANTPDSRTPGQVVVETEPLFEQPPYQITSAVSFGDSIRLEGYTVRPGDGFITVDLVWQALAAPPRDYMVGVFVMADGAQSAIPAQSDAVPGGGLRPTSGWQAGEYVLDSHQLTIPPGTDEAALDNLVLWVNVYDPETGDRLPSDPAGGGPFNAVSIGMVVPPSPPPTAPPQASEPPVYQVASPATFGDAMVLEGYSLSDGPGYLIVELVWRAQAQPTEDYMVGVFLMPEGAQSAIIAQNDSLPVVGTAATSAWQVGQYIVDAHNLTFAPDMPGCRCTVWVSVYKPATGERLPSDPSGSGPFNAMLLATIDLPLPPQPSATPLPYPTGATTAPCLGECTPTPTPYLETEATTAFVATMGWTSTPIGFQPSVTPCQAGCDDSRWATGTAAALAGATGTPTPFDLSATPPPQ